jgi:hypothetical protein
MLRLYLKLGRIRIVCRSYGFGVGLGCACGR